jgi:hypothetical protein
MPRSEMKAMGDSASGIVSGGQKSNSRQSDDRMLQL